MKFADSSLSKEEIEILQKENGNYLKITIDVENANMVIGTELHADGEEVLLKKGSKQGNIWGGGINLVDKQIDATAVLNFRPRLNNDNLEILDSQIREKFISIAKEIFKNLWL